MPPRERCRRMPPPPDGHPDRLRAHFEYERNRNERAHQRNLNYVLAEHPVKLAVHRGTTLAIVAAEHAVALCLVPRAIDRAKARAEIQPDDGLLYALLDELDQVLEAPTIIGRCSGGQRFSLMERIAASRSHAYLIPHLNAVSDLSPDCSTENGDYTSLENAMSKLLLPHNNDCDHNSSEAVTRSSIATSAFSIESTHHSRKRGKQRFGHENKHKLQAALKHAAHRRTPGKPDQEGNPTWLIEYDGVVMCTDESMSNVLSQWPS